MSLRSAANAGTMLALIVWACRAGGSGQSGTLALLAVPASRPDAPTTALYVRGVGSWRKLADVEARRAAWSPDGRHIVLAQGGVGPLWLVTVDTGQVRRLAEAASSPAWSPDGRSLAFSQSGGGIAVAAVPSADVRELRGTERGCIPAWTPDGRSIAFGRSVGGSGSVWTVEVEHGVAERIAVCAKPLALAWSPDGARMAIIEHDPERMASPRLSVVGPGQAAPELICQVRGESVTWTPGGRLLVYGGGSPCTLVDVSSRSAVPVEAGRAGARVLLAGTRPGVTAVAASAQATRSDPTVFVLLDDHSRPVSLMFAEASGPISLPSLPSGLAVIAAAWTGSDLAESQASGRAVAEGSGGAGGSGGSRRRELTSRGSAGRADQVVVSPMVFPVCGEVSWSDTFGSPRGSDRRHAGQDIIAPKMRPVVAAFDGVVTLRRPSAAGGHYWLVLVGDNGWTATYLHLNNDTPGTDDGLGTDQHAFAPGLTTGSRVRAGQLLGYVGDSGNAEDTVSHLHFELAPTATRVPINPGPSLEAAERLAEPVAAGLGWEDCELRPARTSSAVCAIFAYTTECLALVRSPGRWRARRWSNEPRRAIAALRVGCLRAVDPCTDIRFLIAPRWTAESVALNDQI